MEFKHRYTPAVEHEVSFAAKHAEVHLNTWLISFHNHDRKLCSQELA